MAAKRPAPPGEKKKKPRARPPLHLHQWPPPRWSSRGGEGLALAVVGAVGLQPVWTTEAGRGKLTLDLSASKRICPKNQSSTRSYLILQAEIDALVNANAPITGAEATRADTERALATPSRRCTTEANRPKRQARDIARRAAAGSPATPRTTRRGHRVRSHPAHRPNVGQPGRSPRPWFYWLVKRSNCP